MVAGPRLDNTGGMAAMSTFDPQPGDTVMAYWSGEWHPTTITAAADEYDSYLVAIHDPYDGDINTTRVIDYLRPYP